MSISPEVSSQAQVDLGIAARTLRNIGPLENSQNALVPIDLVGLALWDLAQSEGGKATFRRDPLDQSRVELQIEGDVLTAIYLSGTWSLGSIQFVRDRNTFNAGEVATPLGNVAVSSGEFVSYTFGRPTDGAWREDTFNREDVTAELAKSASYITHITALLVKWALVGKGELFEEQLEPISKPT